VDAGFGEVGLSVLCVAAVLTAVVWLIRRRLRVGELPGLPSAAPARRGDMGHDANPREFGGEDGGDDDGGDGGDA
jgi:hypothetical protein